MADKVQTFDVILGEDAGARSARVLRPGLVVLFAGSRPRLVPLPGGGEPIEIGRLHPAFSATLDPRMSRRHASVRVDGGRFIVTDLGSRNGTTVDGDLLAPGVSREVSRVIRVGDTLLLPAPDIAPFLDFGVRVAPGSAVDPSPPRALPVVTRGVVLSHEIASTPPKRPARGMIAAALERHEGNISAASRALGVHRTQLRRWIDRYHMDQHAFTPRREESAPVSSAR